MLLRRLRAAAVVNAQLHAQLRNATAAPSTNGSSAAPAPAPKVRRGGVGDEWLEDLLDGGEDPRLVVASDGTKWLVEGDVRRAVRAGQLVDVLASHLGAPTDLGPGEEQRWPEGPPVEVLEAPSGAPFIVVGGFRHDLRGVMVTYPVDEDLAARLPAGEELRVGAAARPTQPPPAQPSSTFRRQLRRARRVARRILGG